MDLLILKRSRVNLLLNIKSLKTQGLPAAKEGLFTTAY